MLVYTHPSCLLHDPGPGHPECPQRLQHVLDARHSSWPGNAVCSASSWSGAKRHRPSSVN